MNSMENPFDKFSKIYCINLESRKDRLEESLKIFKEYQIDNVIKFKAVDVYSQDFSSRDKKQLAQLGCALSFYSILENNRNENSILIFEDDICFNLDPDSTRKKLNLSLGELPELWDMFYLGANLHVDYRNDPISKFSEHLFKVNCCYALHAVAFSKAGINKFLSHFKDKKDYVNQITKNYFAIDVFVAREILDKGECYISSEILAGQRDGFSSIENFQSKYNEDFINRFDLFKNNL